MGKWSLGEIAYADRMPPLSQESLDARQREVADQLTRGPRGGVKGPFIPLLRSPELVDRLGRIGEYVRFGSSLAPRISELVMLIVARQWTNQFEWAVHVPLALEAGVDRSVVDAIADGRYPKPIVNDEDVAYAICDELARTKSVCETTYRRAIETFGERGLIDIVTVYGYFTTVCAVMNVAHTPPPESDVPRISPFPL